MQQDEQRVRLDLVCPAGYLAFAEERSVFLEVVSPEVVVSPAEEPVLQERSVFLEVVSSEVVVSPAEEPVLQELAFPPVFPLRPSKAMKRRQTALPLTSLSMLSCSYPCPLIFSTRFLPMSVSSTLSTFTASYTPASPTAGVPA